MLILFLPFLFCEDIDDYMQMFVERGEAANITDGIKPENASKGVYDGEKKSKTPEEILASGSSDPNNAKEGQVKNAVENIMGK